MEQQIQQLDAFTQRRFELIIEMTTKKLQQEINLIKESLCSMAGEINSVKSQVSKLQFPPQAASTQKVESQSEIQISHPARETNIVDLRPENEKREGFVSGSAKNAEPIRPRYGNYKPEDVSIDKFFYFGRK